MIREIFYFNENNTYTAHLNREIYEKRIKYQCSLFYSKLRVFIFIKFMFSMKSTI